MYLWLKLLLESTGCQVVELDESVTHRTAIYKSMNHFSPSVIPA